VFQESGNKIKSKTWLNSFLVKKLDKANIIIFKRDSNINIRKYYEELNINK